MIIAKSLQQRYLEDKPHIHKIGEKVNSTLRPFCEKNHFAYTGRYKELESLAEKIETGRYSSWDSIDDLFAATIIIENLNQESKVVNFLKTVFSSCFIKQRGSTIKSPEVFRFDATRVIAKLNPLHGNRQRMHDLNFEIQIRTAFEHAWSVATHSLTYKSDEINWKAIRLSAQIKAAVEQLDMLVSGFSEVDTHITAHEWPDINYKVQILSFILNNFKDGKIPDELRPNNLTRFAENVFAILKSSPNWPKRKEVSKFLENIFNTLSKEISLYSSLTFPRSVSLLQFCMGALISNNILHLPLKGYMPMITDELETIFPSVKKIDQRFAL